MTPGLYLSSQFASRGDDNGSVSNFLGSLQVMENGQHKGHGLS